MLAVSEDLLSTKVLLLESPKSLSLLLLLLCHLCLAHLHLSFEHDLVLLLGSEALEGVWLDAVRSEHRPLSCRVLSHEVVRVRVIDISRGL